MNLPFNHGLRSGSSLMDQLTSQSVDAAFMEDLVLSFGIFAVLLIAATIKLCVVFEESLKALKISIWSLEQRNYKVTSAKKYHHF